MRLRDGVSPFGVPGAVPVCPSPPGCEPASPGPDANQHHPPGCEPASPAGDANPHGHHPDGEPASPPGCEPASNRPDANPHGHHPDANQHHHPRVLNPPGLPASAGGMRGPVWPSLAGRVPAWFPASTAGVRAGAVRVRACGVRGRPSGRRGSDPWLGAGESTLVADGSAPPVGDPPWPGAWRPWKAPPAPADDGVLGDRAVVPLAVGAPVLGHRDVVGLAHHAFAEAADRFLEDRTAAAHDDAGQGRHRDAEPLAAALNPTPTPAPNDPPAAP